MENNLELRVKILNKNICINIILDKVVLLVLWIKLYVNSKG